MNTKMNSFKLSLLSTLVLSSFLGAHTASAQDESDPEKLFKKGMTERATDQLQESIEAFQTILSAEPTLHRARLELATAYFKALNYAAARTEAQRVLDEPSTPAAVKENIRKFLSTIDAADTRHTFTPSVEVGMLFDSNVTAGPASSTFGNIILAPGSTKVHDTALTTAASLSHRYLSPNTMKIGGNNASFAWNTNGTYFRSDYASQGQYDLEGVSVGTGPGLIVAGKWRGGMALQYDDINLGADRYATYIGLSPTLTNIYNRGQTEITYDLGVQNRYFHRPTEVGRDSIYAFAGASVGHVIKSTIALQAGLKYFDEHATYDYYSNSGYETFAGANWQASQATSVYGQVSYRDSLYKATAPNFSIPRNDNLTKATVGASYKFATSILNQWIVSANYTYTDNLSNINVYNYDREQTNVTIGRSF